MTESRPIKEVYGEYLAGRVSYADLIAASERRIAEYERGELPKQAQGKPAER